MQSRREFLKAVGRASILGAGAGWAACRPQEDGKIHLRYMAWGNVEQLATEQKVIDLFHAENPDVHVTLFKTPGTAYRNKMIVMLASRTAPDVIRVDQYDFPQLVRRGYFYDISEFARNDAEWDLADHYPQANEECVYRGRIYGVNALFGGVMAYYNRTLFERAGLEDPYRLWRDGEWTWARFLEGAKALTQWSGNRATQFGFLIPPFVNYAPLLWAYGAEILSPDFRTCLMDSEEAIAALQILIDMRWRDRVCPTPSQGAQNAFAFESGRLGMEFNWMGMSPRYREAVKDFEWDICPLPAGPKGGPTVVKGNQLVMNAETRYPEAAWRFMRHVTGAKVEMFQCGRLRRAMTTRPSIAADPEFLRADQPPRHTDVFAAVIPGGRRLPINYRWLEWSVLRDRHMERLLNGQDRDVRKVLKEMSADITRLLHDQEGF